ncbi:MAG: hypothetical protein U5R06_10725 [candidate division KSB1 bacterium]|nr:hypothetical protein [candidate division KSB1 bacterium]
MKIPENRKFFSESFKKKVSLIPAIAPSTSVRKARIVTGSTDTVHRCTEPRQILCRKQSTSIWDGICIITNKQIKTKVNVGKDAADKPLDINVSGQPENLFAMVD